MAIVSFTNIKDSLDVRILRVVSDGNGLTLYKISKSVGEVDSKVTYRLQRLERGGFIISKDVDDKKLYFLNRELIHLEDNEILITTKPFTVKFNLDEIYDMELNK